MLFARRAELLEERNGLWGIHSGHLPLGRQHLHPGLPAYPKVLESGRAGNCVYARRTMNIPR